jgi:type I restriction-modification system DNA methylase subunit
MTAETVQGATYWPGDEQLALLPPATPVLTELTAVEADAAHGEVFTRRWVVELILDLVGYTATDDLAVRKAVEPACGTGAFLGPLVKRLSASCRRHNRAITDAADALQAFDLLPRNVIAARRVVAETLRADGWALDEIDNLTTRWVQAADYLLRPSQASAADWVVGNPPYIRLEDVADDRMAAYRRACLTMGGRADVYVGFFEVALR